jgi:lipopolysaccharide export LptBFGC system permease protein LptF
METLPGRRVLALARRICPAAVVERLVVPALADLQHEHRHAAGRWPRVRSLLLGYAGLLAALMQHAGGTAVRALRDDWGHGGGRGWQLVGPAADRGAFVLALGTIGFLGYVPPSVFAWSTDLTVLLQAAIATLPCILATTVPAALLLGLILGLRRLALATGDHPRRWRGPALVLSCAVAVAVFVLQGWLMPLGFRAFYDLAVRTVTGQAAPATHGPRDLSWPALAGYIQGLDAAGTPSGHARLHWHEQMARPAACVLLGPLAVGLASRRRGRGATARALAAGLACLLALSLGLAFGMRAAMDGHVPAALGVWAGALLPPLGALVILALRRPAAPSPSAAGGPRA